MNISLLSAKIQAYLGYVVNCSFNKEEQLFIVEVFSVPKHLKKRVRHILYGLEKTLFKEEIISISAIPYSTEDTMEYFPEMVSKTQECDTRKDVIEYHNQEIMTISLSQDILLAA